MADIPEAAIAAAADAIMSAANMNDDEPERWESRHLARAALEAAAPLLAEAWGNDMERERQAWREWGRKQEVLARGIPAVPLKAEEG
jgi:hypothetical protein